MLPGGAAANALAYTGLRFHGPLGATAVYAAFIAPGAAIVAVLAAPYVHLGVAPRFAPLLTGLNAAVVGIVASITLKMVRGVGRAWQMVVASAAVLLGLGGGASAGEIAILGIIAGLAMDLGTKRLRLARLRHRDSATSCGAPPARRSRRSRRHHPRPVARSSGGAGSPQRDCSRSPGSRSIRSG